MKKFFGSQDNTTITYMDEGSQEAFNTIRIAIALACLAGVIVLPVLAVLQ